MAMIALLAAKAAMLARSHHRENHSTFHARDLDIRIGNLTCLTTKLALASAGIIDHRAATVQAERSLRKCPRAKRFTFHSTIPTQLRAILWWPAFLSPLRLVKPSSTLLAEKGAIQLRRLLGMTAWRGPYRCCRTIAASARTIQMSVLSPRVTSGEGLPTMGAEKCVRLGVHRNLPFLCQAGAVTAAPGNSIVISSLRVEQKTEG
jgi:hypothetical protein